MEDWLIALISLGFSAIFSGLEIAFVSSNKLKIELDRSKGLFAAKILSEFFEKPSKLLSALLLGNNIALVVYGIAMARLLDPMIVIFLGPEISSEFLTLTFQTLISTLFILIAGEFIPKVLVRTHSNRVLNVFAIPVKAYYWVFYPFIHSVVWIAETILKKMFRLKLVYHDYQFSHVDLDHYIMEYSKGVKEAEEAKQEIQMLQNALEFRKIRLRECMVPRTEITAVEQNDSIENLTSSFIGTGLSKILVYNGTVDNIIGFVHSSDIFKKPVNIISVTHSLPIIPETALANNVLSMFIREAKSMALVVDEFGGTSGIITMEDIIEEIFGEIEDEFDVEEMVEKQISKNEFVFSARLEIDYLNEKYDLNLPESDDYETLGGLIIFIHESIPSVNEVITIDSFRITIRQATASRIDLVHLVVTKAGD
jgi:CBS domain containing-hemolysin-like protein